ELRRACRGISCLCPKLRRADSECRFRYAWRRLVRRCESRALLPACSLRRTWKRFVPSQVYGSSWPSFAPRCLTTTMDHITLLESLVSVIIDYTGRWRRTRDINRLRRGAWFFIFYWLIS